MKYEVGTSEEFPIDRPVPRTVAEQKLVIVRTNSAIFAMENECPHQSQSLETGTVIENTLKCRYHGVTMDLASGAIAHDGGYIGLQGIKVFPVHEENNQVYVVI